MGDRQAQLHCRQGAGQGRIGVAIDDDHIGLHRNHDRLERRQHPPRHLAVAAAMNAEMARRRGDGELAEENIGHVVIEVLAGMDHDFSGARFSGDGAAQHRRLDELRPRTDDRQDAQRHVRSIAASGRFDRGGRHLGSHAPAQQIEQDEDPLVVRDR